MRPRSSNSVEAAGKPRYPDEDTRPTSQQELAGWYFYGIAAETYVICGISSFIPILLETLAREHGVLYSDRKTPCLDSTHSRKGDGQCVVQLFGFEINTASFAMYFFSASVLLQALLVVSISSAADHGKSRKRLLLTFAWIGSAAVMAYIFITTDVYLVGGVLLIISNTAFGASFVLLNSFMPLLVRYHPKVLYAESSIPTLESSELDRSQSEANDEAATASAPLLLPGGVTEPAPPALKPTTPNGMHPNPHVLLTELQLSTEISSKGVGIGYSAALFVQCVSIIIMLSMGSSTWSQRVVLLFVGSWWAFFTIPTALWLRPRPGPPLQQTGSNGSMAWFSYVQQSWKSLWRTVKLTRRLVDIVLFLVSWFLLSDAIATTSSTAILFAKTTLGMPAWALGLISVITSVTGVLGAFSWSFISKKLGLRPHQTILACIGLFELVPLYGLLGYLPIVQRWGVFGLQQRWEMYPLGALYGFVLGGLSSYCRSLYGELIPPGSEAAFYALYAITDKGSSVFGPAIVGTIIDATGDIRPGFFFLAFLIGAPVPFIYFVDVERGKRAGAKLARVIEGCDSREDMSSSDDADGEEEGRRMLVDYECDSGGAGGEGDATGFRTIGEHETGPTADGKYTTSTSNAVRQR